MVDADLLVALGFAAVTRGVVLAAALVLLWLRPRSVAKRLLGASLLVLALAGVTDAGFLLGFPGGQDVWFYFQTLLFEVSALFLFGFLAQYPTPVKWRSPMGLAHLAILAYAVAAPAVLIATERSAPRPPVLREMVEYYSIAYGLLGMLSVALSLERARRLPDAERAVARRLVVAVTAASWVFLGYMLVADPLKLLGIAHHQRYGGDGPLVADARWAYTLFGTGLGFCGWLWWRHDAKWPLFVLAPFGALALLLDQFSKYDIIDFGLVNLVLPIVAMQAAARDGAFGVKRVPARVGTAVSLLTGVSVCILVAAAFTLAAGQAPFFLMVGSLTGLVLGATVAYQIRPRGVGIAIYRHPEEGAPAQALTGTRVAPGALLAGRYRVDRVLGEGGEGHAFLARDETLARDVVLKSLTSGGRAAVREARIVAMLDHPNVVRVHDVLETAHETLLVLEHVDGGSLRGLLARRGPLPRAEADAVMSQILAGLEAAHAAGVVHGDVKPENVLLGSDGRPKLADFGSATTQERIGTATGATVQERPSGTLAYMSPEQARGEPATERSDIYAAGLCYHELLTGARIRDLRGLDALQARALVATTEPALRVTEPALVSFLQKALAREPGARFASAAEMRAALNARTG